MATTTRMNSSDVVAPQTLLMCASRAYEDENLKGFFCEFLITPYYEDHDYTQFCACQDGYECGCDREMREQALRRTIYNNEHDFARWKALVWKFNSNYCPVHRYGDKFGDNYLYISPHFYILHKDWFKQWNAISSIDECRALLRKRTQLLMSGDVESNPGPVANQRLVIETIYKLKMRAMEHARQRCEDKLKVQRRQNKQCRANEALMKKKLDALDRAQERKIEKSNTLCKRQAREDKENFDFQGPFDAINTPVGRSVMYGLANMAIPGTGTAAATAVEGPKLFKLLEKTNITMSQMQEAMETMKDQVPAAISKHMVMTDLASATLSTLGDILDQVKTGMTTLKETFVGLKDRVLAMSPMTLVVSIIMCFVAASLPMKYLIGPTLILVGYLLGWHQAIIDKVKQLLGKYNWFDGWQFQDGEDRLIAFIGQTAFTILAFFGISQIPTDKFYDSLLRRLDIIPKACAGVGKIWNAAGDTYRAVEMEFKVFFLGRDRERLIDEAAVGEDVTKWVKRVDHYMQIQNLKSLSKDAEAVEEVTMLFDQMSRWKHTRMWNGLSKEAQRIIDALASTMSKLYSEVLRSSVHEGGPRIPPLSVMLSGEAGRGKSQILIPLSYALLHGRNHRGNFKNEIYLRNYETEFWDGYVNQTVVHFDDAFQVKDSISKPSAEFMEAIRINNVAPCHVHCADLKDKGRFFTSEICLYTTNLNKEFKKYIVSLNCPEAALRRLNMNAFEVLNKPEYESELPNDEGKVAMRLDPTKVKNCERCKAVAEARADKKQLPFCQHLYLFQRYNIVTDQPIGEKMEYSEFVQYLLAVDRKQRTTEKDLLEQYEILEEDPFAFQDGDDDEFEDAVDMPFIPQETNHELALNLSVPTDYLAYHQLQCFYLGFEQFAKERGIQNWHERMLSELAYDEQNYATYQRLVQYGIRNKDKPNKSLLHAMPDICYDPDASIFMRSKHYPTWAVLRDSFYAYCAKIGDQLKYIWDNSGFSELLTISYFVISIISGCFVIYRKFTEKDQICFRCEMEKPWCVCTLSLYWEKGELSETEKKEKARLTKAKQLLEAYEREQMHTESAGSSGEHQQQVKAQMKTESAGSSGDHQQQAKAQMRTEAAGSSGDHQQQTKTQMRTEAAGSSGEHQQQPKTQMRTEGEKVMNLEDVEISDVPIFEALSDQCGRQVTVAITTRNLYCLHSEKTIYGNVIFLKGSTFLMPYHFVTAIKFNKSNIGKTMYLSNMAGRSMMEVCTDDLLNAIRLVKDGDELDAAIVTLDPIKNKAMAAHPNIVKNFITKSDIMCFNENNKYEGEIPSYCEMSTDLQKFIPNVKSCRAIQGYYDSKTMIPVQNEHTYIHFRKMWTYMARTVKGDCGAPLVIHDQSSSKKILGIHVAGQPSGIGLAQCITQEMLNEAFEKVPLKFQCAVSVDHMIEEVPDFDVQQVGSVPLRAGLIVHGKIADSMRVRSGGKTKITPSKLHNTIKESLTMPTIMGPTNGIDPMELGLKKFGKITPRIDPKLIELAATDVQNNLEVNKLDLDKKAYARVLTYEEAVKGVEGDEYLAPLNRGTSLGYPYTVKYPHAKGKRTAFGNDEWTMDTPLALEIENDVNELIGSCKANVQENVFWTDTLKDERRPIAKVQAGKTRVFCAGPVHFTIAFRQYFLGFAAWLMKNRNANEISTGTNVFSYDWQEIVAKLQSRGKQDGRTNVVAGDFENFDGSLSSQILWKMLDMINEWYDDGDENANIRRVMWMNIVHAVHVNGTMMYQATHSQPSGCPLTAILNSIYNSIVIRIVFMICAIKEENRLKLRTGTLANMKNFNEWVACVSYGDDNLIAIIQSILDWFNQVTIAEAFLTIGHVYTDEAKSGVIVPIRRLEDVAYLKRKFVWDELTQRHIAPLDLDVVLEIFQWTKKGLMKDDITQANVDVTMRELALHGEDAFNHWRDALKRECVAQGIKYRFRSFEEYKTEVLDAPIKFEGQEVDKDVEDIFKDPNYITHCVSADFKMSAGFARKLLKSGRMVNTRQIQYLRTRQHQVGFVAIDHQSRVIHMVTKEKFNHKPSDFKGMIRVLSNLNLLLQKQDIKQISMPAMGCGLDSTENKMCVKDLQALTRMLLPNIACKIYV